MGMYADDDQDIGRSVLQYAFLGVPWEHGAASGGGQMNGPQAVREVIYGNRWGKHPWINFPIDQLRIQDHGDIWVSQRREDAALQVRTDMADMRATKMVPVLVGGDDSLNLEAIAAVAGEIDLVVHFDAHRDNQVSKDRDHATWVSDLLDECPQIRVLTIGSRSPHDMEVKREDDRHQFCDNLLSLDLFQFPHDRIWVAVDIDVVDPAFAPEVVAPVPGGMSASVFLRSMSALGHDLQTLVGASFTEVAPQSYEHCAAADLVAYGIAYLLAGHEAGLAQ